MGNATRTWLLGLLLGLVVAGACAAQAGKPVVCEGKHFVVEFLPGKLPEDVSQLVADDALAAAEGMWPALQKAMTVKTSSPPRIFVYGDELAYRAVERAASPLKVLVDDFVLADGTAAHVPMVPAMSKDVLMAVGLPENTRQAIQRCCVQAAVLQSSDAARQDPWLAEIIGYGLMEGASNPRCAGGVDPLFDQRRQAHRYRMTQGRTDRLSDRLLDTEPAKDVGEQRASRNSSAVIAQLLADASSAWPRKLLAKSPKALGVVPYRLAAFDNVLGKDRDKAEVRWQATRKQLEPVWFCKGSVGTRDGRLELVGGVADVSLVGLQTDLPPSDYAVCGTFRLAPVGGADFRVELDWDTTSLVGVWLREGQFTIERWTPKTTWEEPIAEGKVPVPIDAPFDLRIEVGATLRVVLDGIEIASVPGKDRTWRGVWSVASHDSIVQIENLRVEPLPAKK